MKEPKTDLSEKELKTAFQLWKKNYNFNDVDDELTPYLNDNIKSHSEKNGGWLAKTRKALFLSAQTISVNLNITRSAYSQLETSEENGTISLTSLAKAAAAMNCELVYVIRPKNKKNYALQIWEKLLAKALQHSWLQNCDQRKRGPALARIALDTMNEAEFRRRQNWSRKSNLLN